jgi:hypothetical protein
MSRIDTLKDLKIVRFMPHLQVQGLLTDDNYIACQEKIRQMNYDIIGLQDAQSYYEKGVRKWSKYYAAAYKEQVNGVNQVTYDDLVLEEIFEDVVENGELVEIVATVNYYSNNDTVTFQKSWTEYLSNNRTAQVHAQRVATTIDQMVETAPKLYMPNPLGGNPIPLVFTDNLFISVSAEDVVNELFLHYSTEIEQYKVVHNPQAWKDAMDNETDLRILAFLLQIVIFIDANANVITVPFRELIKAELYDKHAL